MLKEMTQAETSANFSSFNLHPRIEAGIKALGYETPTPIQAYTIPPILESRDVLGLAQTGTGKTAAFILPILQRLMTGTRRKLRVLILAPTRELADQIQEVLCQLGSETKLKGITLYGGVSKIPQIRRLRDGVEIVVACPGRLLDLMNQGEVNVSALETLVIDEADRMFDMGFLPDIRKIVSRLPVKRQTLLFSATMSPEIRRLTKEVMDRPQLIRVDDDRPVSTVSHAVYPVASHLKTSLLMTLLDKTDTASVLVFTRTKSRATRLAQHIMKAGYGAASLQGDLPQTQRQEALNGFRDGRYRILVATDIAARGIDVSHISHVINFDMPDTVDGYTHRIGRTGRADKTGDAFSFVTSDDRSFVWAIEKALGETIEKRTLSDFNYGLPAPAIRAGETDRPHRSGGPKAFSRTPARTLDGWVRPAASVARPAGGFRSRRKSVGR